MFTVLALILRQNPNVIEDAWTIGTVMLVVAILYAVVNVLVWLAAAVSS